MIGKYKSIMSLLGQVAQGACNAFVRGCVPLMLYYSNNITSLSSVFWNIWSWSWTWSSKVHGLFNATSPNENEYDDISWSNLLGWYLSFISHRVQLWRTKWMTQNKVDIIWLDDRKKVPIDIYKLVNVAVITQEQTQKDGSNKELSI